MKIWAPCGTAPRPKHSNVVGAWPGFMFVFVLIAGRPVSSSLLVSTFYFPSRACRTHFMGVEKGAPQATAHTRARTHTHTYTRHHAPTRLVFHMARRTGESQLQGQAADRQLREALVAGLRPQLCVPREVHGVPTRLAPPRGSSTRIRKHEPAPRSIRRPKRQPKTCHLCPPKSQR